MLCTHPSSAGPSAPRTTGIPTYAPTCASAYCSPSSMPDNAIFPFPGPAPALHQRELYLRALEQEREEILAEAYASKRSGSPVDTHAEEYIRNIEDYDSEDESSSRFDDRGRQLSFRETVRQRQARLEFLRRQDFGRRIAHRGLEDAKASAYAIKRLPRPRVRPIERVNAAIKIQTAWRLHHTTRSLDSISERVRESHEKFVRDSKTDYDTAWRTHAETLHELLKELGERTGVLSAQSHTSGKSDSQTTHPRVRLAARKAMDALRAELSLLDRAQISRHSVSAAPSSPFMTGSPVSSDSEDDDDEYDDDEEYDSEDDDDCASYTYTPPQLVNTELYVVDEEDEEELDEEVHIREQPVSSNAMRLYTTPKARPTGPRHQGFRHAPLSIRAPTPIVAAKSVPIPINTPGLIRSPLSRSPTLASIPEEDEF